MEKPKESYKSDDDSRFKKFDKVLDPSYGQKQYYILLAGIIIVCTMLVANTLTGVLNAQPNSKLVYEDGLNISYNPEDKLFLISFTNPKSDTSVLSTLIQVPFDTQSQSTTYLTVYEYSSSQFPINITYTPYERVSTITHFVTVTLRKETGNYTYAYSVVPDTENKLWKETGNYVQKIQGLFSNNESI